jgi:CubicO group peptidase (beta-lactamase class C family)
VTGPAVRTTLLSLAVLFAAAAPRAEAQRGWTDFTRRFDGFADRITRWVPELREIHDPDGMADGITIRMLLAHSSGLQNPFEPATWAGYIYLARVVEKLTGDPWAVYVQKNL